MKVDSIASRILRTVEDLSKHYRDTIRCIEYEGSYAKDTWLSGEYDLDLFLYFNLDVDLDAMKAITRAIVYRAAPLLGARVEKRYAAHPYYTVVLENGVEVDIVPAYYVEHYSQVKTPVDRTRLHTLYVKKILEEKPSLKDDIRLLKKMLKRHYIYGAELEVQGFSGYLCELLTIFYGGFNELLENAAKWRPWRTIIPPTAEPSMDAPLVVVDPVDPRRNAAAAVSIESLHKVIGLARVASGSPEKTCCIFSPKTGVGEKTLDESSVFIVALNFVGSKSRSPQERAGIAQKHRRRIITVAEKNGFTILRSRVFLCDDEALLVFQVFPSKMPPKELHEGPPVYAEASIGFLNKWARIGVPLYIINGRWTALIDRRIRYFDEIIGKVLSQDERISWRPLNVPYIKSKCPTAYTWLKEGESWIYCAAIKRES